MINERIRKIRLSLNLTQEAFAKSLGINRAHISRIETGKVNPSSTLIKLIISEFKISEEWLLSGNGNMENNNMQKLKKNIFDDLLKAIVIIVEECISEMQISMPPDKKSDLFNILYESYSARESVTDRNELKFSVLKFLKLMGYTEINKKQKNEENTSKTSGISDKGCIDLSNSKDASISGDNNTITNKNENNIISSIPDKGYIDLSNAKNTNINGNSNQITNINKNNKISNISNIKGNNNIIGSEHVKITTKNIKNHILPPPNSIGANSLLKEKIQSLFNKLGEEREKRFGKRSYPVMYGKFKKDFGIKSNPWTIIWTWNEECAPAIIEYLEHKYSNTIQGRKEAASKKENYIHTRPYLYKIENELLAHFGWKTDSPEVKDLLAQFFDVTSHRHITHLQHWQFVKYLEKRVSELEKQ